MPDFTVRRRGTDTSGRAILMTDYAWHVWTVGVLNDPRVKPFAWKIIIVQGAFMARLGGGATASAGVHDKAGCWDIRTWNLTLAEQLILVRVCREVALAIWRRDKTPQRGNMDPHAHITFGADHPLATGAVASWRGYLNNENGLASRGRDYEWRPSPLVTKPPAWIFEEDEMASTEALQALARIEAMVGDVATELDQFREVSWRRARADRERQSRRYRDLVTKIGALADQLTGEQRELVLQILRSEKDVTREDNPAN